MKLEENFCLHSIELKTLEFARHKRQKRRDIFLQGSRGGFQREEHGMQIRELEREGARGHPSGEDF